MNKLWLISLLLCGCTYSVAPDGSKNLAMGGKGAYKSKGMAVTWDNEKSFSDGTIAATAIAGLAYSASTAAEQEITSRTVNTNSTKQAINASNNATKEVISGQKTGVEIAKIPKP